MTPRCGRKDHHGSIGHTRTCPGEAVIKPDARFREDLGADSLDLVTLLMALEQEFGGSISDAEAAGMTTVGQAQALISSLNASSVTKGSL